MNELTQNDWDQSDMINNTEIWTKGGSDTIHAIDPTKYQK